ncbi:GPW/gp25 family protein [Plebeiibacterium sediminum]|uniref:GPW/gp25 family protein n=1 Tax=Plebeiibacterium sediminum TaxID=2992112 RepID=A0AAE3SGV3_9BACT|nr:GPW/gp25 family protein [Plebeiobacterium sediminum]MCW3788878.1 GPW/gp25 family protein [Plebeiobacterium sediminum]
MTTEGYFNYPLDVGKIIKGNTLHRISLRESISQHLHLIITSYLGENLFEPSFGCAIWQYDFDNTITDNRLRDLIKDSLEKAILSQEVRLKGVAIKVIISQSEINSLAVLKRIKKRVDIEVDAFLVSTNEAFKYFEYFYLGPLSYF